MRTPVGVVAILSALPLLGAAREPAQYGIQDVAWLAGSWVHETAGSRAEEHWMAPAGGTMSGMAR